MPYYLHYGMSPREFWEEDPRLAGVYRRKHDLDIEDASQRMWLQGLYVYDALQVALFNVFKKKGTKAARYREEPIRLTPLTEEEKRVKAKNERKKLIERLNRWQADWQRREKRKNSHS